MNILHANVTESAVDDENFVLGIVRLTPERKVTFINRAARAMVGDEIRIGMNFADLPLDPQSQNNFRQAMDDRFEKQRGTSYRIRLVRRDSGTRVQILVSAVPEYDTAGQLVGSIGLFTDESLDAATAAMHQAIAGAKDCRELLAGIRAVLRDVVRFDSITVGELSKNRRHLRQVFEDPPPAQQVSPTMWWPMPEFIKTLIDDFQPGPMNLDEWFRSAKFQAYAEADPAVRQFEQRGFRHSLRLGVYQRNALVATLSLMRKDNTPFTCEEYERCTRLPIAEAVRAAMAFDENRELNFGIDFVRSIGKASHDSLAIAQTLVDQLVQHYQWSYVALFRVSPEENRIDLICQGGTGSSRLPTGYSQACTVGLIGKAHLEGKPLNAGDVRSAQWARSYHAIIEGTLSELVLPVPGTNGQWLLNIESSLRDAFEDDEQQSIETHLQVVGFILERISALELKTAVLDSIADAVIQTNELGVIVQVNPAAEFLFGRQRSELLHRSLALFVDTGPDSLSEESETEVNAWKFSNTTVAPESPCTVLLKVLDSPEPLPVKLKRPDDVLIPVLMSAARLEGRLQGHVFVASDLTVQNRIERMEVLNKVFRQIVSEIRIPISLASAFLEEALEEPASEPRSAIDKSLKQIRKADLPLERVLRTANQSNNEPLPRQVFDLKQMIDELMAELPGGDTKSIVLHAQGQRALVRAPRHELLFCIRSLLAYLIRRRAQVERVDLGWRRRRDSALVSITLPHRRAASSPPPSAASAEVDLALSEPVIEDLMNRMGGSYFADTARRRFRLLFAAGD